MHRVTIEFGSPITGRIALSSLSGDRQHPTIKGKIENHGGVDISVPENTKVFAAASGSVARSSWHKSFGNVVVIDHGGGVFTTYAHLNSLAVPFGKMINRGDVLGLSGNTGLSKGPHLHFEVGAFKGNDAVSNKILREGPFGIMQNDARLNPLLIVPLGVDVDVEPLGFLANAAAWLGFDEGPEPIGSQGLQVTFEDGKVDGVSTSPYRSDPLEYKKGSPAPAPVVERVERQSIASSPPANHLSFHAKALSQHRSIFSEMEIERKARAAKDAAERKNREAERKSDKDRESRRKTADRKKADDKQKADEQRKNSQRAQKQQDDRRRSADQRRQAESEGRAVRAARVRAAASKTRMDQGEVRVGNIRIVRTYYN